MRKIICHTFALLFVCFNFTSLYCAQDQDLDQIAEEDRCMDRLAAYFQPMTITNDDEREKFEITIYYRSPTDIRTEITSFVEPCKKAIKTLAKLLVEMDNIALSEIKHSAASALLHNSDSSNSDSSDESDSEHGVVRAKIRFFEAWGKE